MERDKHFGRYEKGNHFVLLAKCKDNKVTYSYGIVGFGVKQSVNTDMDAAADMATSLQSDGYIKADETPTSEIGYTDSGALLDWMNGVSR